MCHYGQHSFGHYIAYRRKPRSVGGERWAPPRIVDPIKVEEMMMAGKIEGEGDNDSLGLDMPEYVFEDDPLINNPSSRNRGRGWLRISDDSVRECGIESVLQEGSGAFMLYYERAEHARVGGVYPYPSLGSSSSVRTTGSAETLKPEIRTLDLNGSVGSLVSEVGVGVKKEEKGLSSSALLVGKEKEDEGKGKGREGVGMSSSLVLGTSPSHPQLLGPRVVRNIAAGRARTVEREAGSSVSSSLSSLDPVGSRSSRPLTSAQPSSSSSSGASKSSSWPNNGVMKSPSLPSNGVTKPPSPNNGVTKSSSLPTSTQPIPIPIPKNSKKTGPLQMNGRPHFVKEEETGEEEGMMTASAPSILVNPRAKTTTTKVHTNTSTSSKAEDEHPTAKPPPPRIQSPKPIHPSPVVGLKA